ncbi:GIY-YIG nuclease family protein [Methylobacter tundripaludum]|uniref:GIY-YIG nuclease family protein n=1 Tax=Methylobacter tundripaludum TaxID=173365 RepID=UPI00068CF6A9|nr:GIY-YIG nuclease family protein [Methylobacter tundripaludum]
MRFEEISKKLDRFTEIFSSDFEVFIIRTILPPKRSLIKHWNNEGELPVPVRGDDIGNRSGVYFLLSDTDEILYIGKATTNNIHERIWGHLKTPSIKENNERYFPKNNFQNRGLNDSFVSMVTDGNIRVAAIEVVPSHISSLVEVYLHTVYFEHNGKIPELNKQIG